LPQALGCLTVATEIFLAALRSALSEWPPLDTTEGGLALAVLFRRVSAHMARPGRVGWVSRYNGIPCSATDEISLSLDGIHTGLLIASNQEGDEHATGEGQQRDVCQSLKSQHALVIDSTFWTKWGLDALIADVSFTGFANAADSQLRGELVGGTQLTIDQLLQAKLMSGVFRKGDTCYIEGNDEMRSLGRSTRRVATFTLID